jgi:5-formyltetrahydrofolate cyclo-ligase
MPTDNKDSADAGAPASPPCMLDELDPEGRVRIPERVEDVARWRKAERERLLAARLALTPEYRAAQTLAIVSGIARLAVIGPDSVVSVYWPMRAEPDLRPWMARLCENGQRVALPVVVARGKPLEFREWRPGARLARGIWNIPCPADGAPVWPTVAIAPVVGFDGQCYRLGYGGGYFDRTLAKLDLRPLAIGIGYPSAALATIYPQPHDVPMDWIVTGTTAPISRGARVTST